MPKDERGSRERYNEDGCPKCSRIFCADTPNYGKGMTFPVSPETRVKCLSCDYEGPISEFWEAFDEWYKKEGFEE